VRLSRNSREAISWMKWAPPFLTQVSVSCQAGQQLHGGASAVSHTFSAASWTLGFLWPMRFFNERMASLGCTVLDRITSEISRFSGMSSLDAVSTRCYSSPPEGSTHRLEDVARSICSSKAPFAEEPNQPAMVSGGLRAAGVSCGGLRVWWSYARGSWSFSSSVRRVDVLARRRCRWRCSRRLTCARPSSVHLRRHRAAVEAALGARACVNPDPGHITNRDPPKSPSTAQSDRPTTPFTALPFTTKLPSRAHARPTPSPPAVAHTHTTQTPRATTAPQHCARPPNHTPQATALLALALDYAPPAQCVECGIECSCSLPPRDTPPPAP
jgi:hypothetical protein